MSTKVILAAEIAALKQKLESQLARSKQMNMGYTAEEASYEDGKESAMETFIDDLEEMLNEKIHDIA